MDNHAVKYKPFVNPFYKEGIGRRTGAVLKSTVRKDSDGFEIFDDYFSESEAENSELSFDKENISSKANRSKRTGRFQQNQKRSSPLRPMKSFSPAALTDRSVVKSSEESSSLRSEEVIQGNPDDVESKDNNADKIQDEVAGSSDQEAVSSEAVSNSEEEVVPEVREISQQVPDRDEGGKNETDVETSDKENKVSSSEEEELTEEKENNRVSAKGVTGKDEASDEPSDDKNRQTSSEEEDTEEKKRTSIRGVTGKGETEEQSSDKETSRSSSEEEDVPGVVEDEATSSRGVVHEDESEEVTVVEKVATSEEDENIVTFKTDKVQDNSGKEIGQDVVESNEESAPSEKSSSDIELEKTRNHKNGPCPEKEEKASIDSPSRAQAFALTKKRLSFSCATEEDVPASSNKDGGNVATDKRERMNKILENPEKEELVGENQDVPSFLDMINSKRKSGAVFSFRFSEILSSTANVSGNQTDQPDDDNIVIVSEEKEKSFFGNTFRKPGMKESGKQKVDSKEKSEKKRKSKDDEKKLKGNGKGKDTSDSQESGGKQATVTGMETKDEIVSRGETLKKRRKNQERKKDEDAGQHHEDNVNPTSHVRETREEVVGKENDLPDVDEAASGDESHIPDDDDDDDDDAVEGEDQVFIETSKGQNMNDIGKAGSRRKAIERKRTSTSRAKKEEENVRKKSLKEDSKKEKKGSSSKKKSGMDKSRGSKIGTSDEEGDNIEIGDVAEKSVTESRKGTTVIRRSSRRLKSITESKMETSHLSKVQDESRKERDECLAETALEMQEAAPAEVNSDDDEIIMGVSNVVGTSVIEKDGGRKRKSSKPLKSTSMAKKGKKNDRSKVEENPKIKRKGSCSREPSEVEEMSVSEENSEKDKEHMVKEDSKEGMTNEEKKADGFVCKISSEVDEKKTNGRKKSVSTTARKGRQESKKGESELTLKEDEDGTEVIENAVTNFTRQRRSKRILSNTEKIIEKDESGTDKETQNLGKKETRKKKNKNGKEMEGNIAENGSSSSEVAETEEQSSSCRSEEDIIESMGDTKMTKRSFLKEKKNKRSKRAKKKKMPSAEYLENDSNSQLEEDKRKRTRKTESIASHLHDNEDDEETKSGKHTHDEEKEEEATVVDGDGVQEGGSSKVGNEKNGGDIDHTIDDHTLKISSRKRKSTSLHSTKSKVKRGDRSKEERINTVKKTLDYGEEEDSDWEEVADGDDEDVVNDGTEEDDGMPLDHESEKTNATRVSPSKEIEENSEQKGQKNDSPDQQQAGSSIPQSILKSSKVYQKHRKNRRQRNLRLTFHEIAKPKAWIIPPNRDQKGTRRSKRNRVRPLEYWRNERAVYERRKSGGFALTGVNSPEDPDDPYKRSRKGRNTRKGGMRTRLLTPKNLSLHRSAPDDAIPGCSDPVAVVNPESQREVLVDVVKTPQSNIYVGPTGNKATETDSFILTKALLQPAFSSGILSIRPESEKGLQLVQRDTMVFHIIRGKVAVTIHQTTQILESGTFFFVPQGNAYNIVNLRKDEAKLVFFQLKGSLDI